VDQLNPNHDFYAFSEGRVIAMRVISVTIGRPRPVMHDDEVVHTGIFKRPASGPISVTADGLTGDEQADRSAHGGPDKAVYAYPFAHYPYWEEQLGRDDLHYGIFGENLTITQLDEAELCIGDTLRVGSALISPTQPRVPCFKLAIRLGEDPKFVKRFLHSERLGVYFRVVEPGTISVGDDVTVESRSPAGVSVLDVIRVHSKGRKDIDGLRRVLTADGLSAEWRRTFENRLAEAELVS
jgi:MOSC domain-containing protein YiiM